jgi:hypothetical protein
MGIITWILLGLVAGWLADKVMRGGYGLWATSSSAWLARSPPVNLVAASSVEI